MKVISLVIFAFLIVGCTTLYSPPDLPPTETSSLFFEQKNIGFIAWGSVAIDKIDGLPLSNASALSFSRYMDEIKVAPGMHVLKLNYKQGLRMGDMSLWFIAEPGTNYIVRGEVIGYNYRLWIEEIESGKEVGGMVRNLDVRL